MELMSGIWETLFVDIALERFEHIIYWSTMQEMGYSDIVEISEKPNPLESH